MSAPRLPRPARTLVRSARRRVREWSEESQREACLNARLASRQLAVQRAERDEVETFLATRPSRRGADHSA